VPLDVRFVLASSQKSPFLIRRLQGERWPAGSAPAPFAELWVGGGSFASDAPSDETDYKKCDFTRFIRVDWLAVTRATPCPLVTVRDGEGVAAVAEPTGMRA